MRSRPKLAVAISPTDPLPGDDLHVEVRLTSESDTPLDRVIIELVGEETARIPHETGKLSQASGDLRHEHVRLRAEIPGRPLTPGTHVYKAVFSLPEPLPLPYRGSLATIAYALLVRVEIPWWPDRSGRFTVPLAAAPPEIEHQAVVFVTDPRGAKSGELYAELSLASTTCTPGGDLAGTVAFTNVARAQRAAIALVATERVGSDPEDPERCSSAELNRWILELTRGPLADGAGLPFRLRVPDDASPSYEGAISALDWTLEVTVPSRLSTRTVLTAPLRVVPKGGVARRARAEAPAVGRERRAEILARVAERLGLRHDDEHEQLRGDEGEVALRIGPETRPDGTLATVAHLAWPSLGMRLSVTPRRWTDAIAPPRMQTGIAAFDRRFRVQSRFSEQARAVFAAELCERLSAFDDVAVDDEGATLAVPWALADEASIAVFAERSIALARAFDAALARVPLPPAIASGLEAWRGLAARLDGRFEPGRGAVHGGTLGLERVEIVTEWDDQGDEATTIVRVPLDTRIDPDTISPAARALVSSLAESAGGRVTVAEDALTLAIAGAVEDVRALDPALEGLLLLASAVRRREGAGPFRS